MDGVRAYRVRQSPLRHRITILHFQSDGNEKREFSPLCNQLEVFSLIEDALSGRECPSKTVGIVRISPPQGLRRTHHYGLAILILGDQNCIWRLR